MGQGYWVLVFESTHAAITAQKFLQGRIQHAVMPTPRAISASCGISIRVEEGEKPKLDSLLDSGFPIERGEYSLYLVDAQGAAHQDFCADKA